jgi:deoxyribodipyrimidine photolyase-like uncharacterized protein
MSTVSFSSIGTAYTADATIGAMNAVHLLTNAGATAAVELTLRPAKVNDWFIATVKAAYEFKINPNGSEKITSADGATLSGAGKYISADAVGETIEAHCFADGEWTITNSRGTWTVES